MMKQICSYSATLGPIGYLPAPGTMATLATLPIVYGINALDLNPFTHFLVLLSICAVSYCIIAVALPAFNCKDPSAIVLDELCGTLITFWAIPLNLFTLIAGFVFFRFFDIVKPLGIKNIENKPGAWGVLLDDCAAGILANGCVAIAMYVLVFGQL